MLTGACNPWILFWLFIFDSPLQDDGGLQPFAMADDSNDPKDHATPHYIRDCIAGLGAKEDPNRVEVALKAAAALIKKRPAVFLTLP